MRITIVKAEDAEVWCDESESFVFKVISTYYFKDAFGNYVWMSSRSRQECLDYIKSEYGGKYALCTARQSKGSGNLTCSGVGTRKGQRSYN